jgi:hypothetical protein
MAGSAVTDEANGPEAAKALRWIVLAAGTLAVCACTPPHPRAKAPLKTISVLDCPQDQGDLTRTSAAADGKSCVYADGEGDQITLRLISLDGQDVRTVLAPIETELKSELPAVAGQPPPVKTALPGGQARAPTPDEERVDIDLPGIHIHTSGDGHANVDTPGAHVEADDHHPDHAVVQIGGAGTGGVTVNANDRGAQIRLSEKGSGIRATYLLASETPGPHGYRAAGYEVRGPTAGPVVVAILLAKSDDHDDLHHEVRGLLKRNVGS